MLQKKNLPGIALLVAVAIASNFISELVVLGGKHPVEASALAVVLGIALRYWKLIPSACLSGVTKGEKMLIIGIVLMGAGLDAKAIASQGWNLLVIIIVTMVLSFLLIILLASRFKLSSGLGLLLAVGTTICGTSAIAVTAPLIKAKEEETSYAVATVALWGLVAILLYPYLGALVQAPELHFGIFAGTAIHSTPQVIGAGFIYSDAAGQMATAVKLVRNCFMAPVAILVAIWYAKKSASAAVTKGTLLRAFPWFLFGYFIMALLSSQGAFGTDQIKLLSESGKFLILLGMAGVGLSTDFAAFKRVGGTPLLVGLLASVVVAAVSIGLITLLL